MAWRRKGGKEAGTTPVQEGTVPPVPVVEPVADDKAKASRERREAAKQLRKAEGDLKRLNAREEKARRAEERHLRRMSKRLAAIERSERRAAGPVVVLLAALHGAAAFVAILHLYFEDLVLYDAVLYRPSVHWELIAFCYLIAALGSSALVARSPARDFQERARGALYVYFFLALIAVIAGMFVAELLEPMQGLEVDWMPAVWAMLVMLACSAIPAVVLYFVARASSRRLHLTGGYHWAMAGLSATAIVALVLLPVFYMAQLDVMTEVGLSMVMVGGLGMLFPWPALASSFLTEYYTEHEAHAVGG